ncbi:MAG: NAD(P)/FAD-dependent oxidoreductase [Thermodesulfobacteriota bacterium]
MPKRYDVIIAGAGNAGLACARAAAAGGLNVLLIDKRRRGNPGRDWCDVVEKDVFQRLGLGLPPPALWRPVSLPVFFTPDMKDRIDPGNLENRPCPHLYIDRSRMSQWLFDLVEPHPHVEVRTETTILGPELSGTRVTGVRIAGANNGATDVIKGDVVVDASGLHSVIDSRVPYDYPFRADPVNPGDVFIGIKEIISVNDADTLRRTGNRILMGYGGGMAWTMIYRENMIDVGVAVPRTQRAGGIKKLLSGLKDRLGLSSFAPVRRGGGLLPARRCRTRLAGEGYLVAGDAACQINPANGGGISPALLAGHMAGEAIVHAGRSGGNGPASLWDYPRRYITGQGAAFAGLDMMRICFQSLSASDISWLFRKGVIQIHDLAVPFIAGERPPFQVITGLQSAVRGRSRPGLLLKLARALLDARAIETAYRDIPATYHPATVARWENKIRGIAERAGRKRS